MARLWDELILRSHDYIARRNQATIQPRLPALSSFDHLKDGNIFPSPPPIPLAYLRGDEWERQGGLWRRDFAFPSSMPSNYQENRAVVVQTYANDRALHFPAVIVLHGLMTLTLIGYRPFFRSIVEAGASAYALELPYHLRRTPAGFISGELFHTADLEMSWRAIQQAVADVRQLIHYLRAAGAPVIGLLGFSLGAWISALVASFEPEVDFALLALLPARINNLIWRTRLGEPLRRQFVSAGWDISTTFPFYQLLDPCDLSPLISRERLELFAAEFDRFIPFRHTQAVHEAWREPRLHLFPCGHISLMFSSKFKGDLRHALNQQLAMARQREQKVTVVTEEALQALKPDKLTTGSATPTAQPLPHLEVKK
jgi:hypothetical protein